jgi:putative aldouronate transport system substrate-binding protein
MKRALLALSLALCILLSACAGLAADKPSLRILGRDATFDLSSSPVIDILKEITGYPLEFEALPVGDEGTTKLLLLLAGGTPYDMVISYPVHFDRALAAHAVMPLDDLLKNAPALMAAVPADSPSWDRVRGEDGKIYGIPQLSPTGGPVNSIAVRKDLLDAQGIALPTTPNELNDALVKLKAAYPDMIPLTTSDQCDLPSILSAFEGYQSWLEKDGKYLPIQLRDSYRSYIEYVRKLYTEGLLDAEFPANDSATRLSKFTSGKAVMTFFGSWEGPGFYSALETAVPGAQVAYLPFLKDASGVAGVEVNLGLEKIAFIPKTAANPEAAMDYVNTFMANFKEIYIGPEGVDHEVVDGQYRPIMPAFSKHDTVWWFLPAVDEKNVQEWWKARVRKSAEVERGYMDTFAVKAQEGTNIVNHPLAMAQPNDELSKLQGVADVNWRAEMIKIISGALPMEDYEKAVDKWRTDGGDRIVEIVNGILGK